MFAANCKWINYEYIHLGIDCGFGRGSSQTECALNAFFVYFPFSLSLFFSHSHSAPHSHLIYTKFNLLLALINHSAGSRCAIILIYATFTNSKFKLHTIQ